jgi:outer membrane receptor protein involved in Fe transport
MGWGQARDAAPLRPQIVRWSVLALSILISIGARGASQELHGRVVDASGAAIASARVTVSAGKSQTAVTSARGEFSFPDLAPPATLTVVAPSFAEATRTWTGESDFTIVLQPAGLRQEIVVSATRTTADLADVPSNVSVITPTQVASSPGLTLDDALRSAPGFSLFRRSDSRSANPTSQGVSLRGSGASGASRALVLYQGVPLNDPFGGWVYWDRVPKTEIGPIEVLRGSGSGLYGSGALSGVITVAPSTVKTDSLSLRAGVGSDDTNSATLGTSFSLGQWHAGAAGEAFQTDGYIPIPERARGSVDRTANLRYGSGRITIDRSWSRASAFFSGNVFDEGRRNGTALQVNSTRLAEVTTGATVMVGGGALDFRGYGSGQHFYQTFSSVTADRNRETLVRLQQVPAQQAGMSLQWSRAWRVHTFVMGTDLRRVAGSSNETSIAASGAASLTDAGGRQFLAGFFLADTVAIGARLHVSGSLRYDHWRNYDPRTLFFATPTTPVPTAQFLPERTASAVSPSLGATYRVVRGVSLKAAGYGSFRAPTLNELYRSFRLGNVQTQANDALQAERLWGGEAGVLVGSDALHLAASYFENQIHDAVGNRTLSSTPALITRQRQNIGTLRTRGLELELHGQLAPRLSADVSYEFVDAVVHRSLDSALLGLDVPQVPHHAASMLMNYSVKRWNFALGGRYVSRQFDDDLNQFPLSGYFLLEDRVQFRVSDWMRAYVAMENSLDREYQIARTPSVMVGAPRQVRAGLDLNWVMRRGR